MNRELFEKTAVPKAYLRLAFPLVVSMVVTLVYNMVDMYFIARTGNTDLVAGVSISAPIFSLMIAVGDVFGLGGSSVISRLLGQKEMEKGKRLSSFCIYASLCTGIAAAVFLLIFRAQVLAFLGADTQTWEYACQYYTVIVLGAPFVIFPMAPANLLRAEGLSALAMLGTVTGAVVNMLLDPIFISGLGLGAAGAAYATVLGNLMTDVIYIYILLKKSRCLSVHPKYFHVAMPVLGQILSIGIPGCMTNLMNSISVALTNRFLLAYGNIPIAAMGIVMKINLIAVLILVGFAFGGQALVGYNYGAGNKKRLKEILRFAYIFECGLGCCFSILLSLLAPVLIRVFMNDEQIVTYGVRMLRCQQIGMVFIGIVLITCCTFQAAGKAAGAFCLSVSRQGVVFAAVLFVMSRTAGYDGVILSQAISDVITAGMAVVLFRVQLYDSL